MLSSLSQTNSSENLGSALKDLALNTYARPTPRFTFDPAPSLSVSSLVDSSCNSSIFSRSSFSTTPSSSSSEKSLSFTRKSATNLRDKRWSWLGRGRNEDQGRQTFRRLPPVVYDCICDHLRTMWLDEGPTRYLNDLYSLTLTSRNWERGVRDRLYEIVWIPATDLRSTPKRFLLRHKSRLASVRRTLSDRSGLARLVREIRIVGHPLDSITGRDQPNEEICNALASLVSVCPKLEKLSGIYLPHCAKHFALSDALSRCPELREHVVVVGPNSSMLDDADTATGEESKRSRRLRRAPEPLLRPTWDFLHTLMLVRGENGFPEHYNSVFGKLHLLPSLLNLHVSDFSGLDFNDYHFDSLPAGLRSLRLENLPGISEDALLRHFTRKLTLPQRGNLQSLTMINLPFNCISNLALLLSLLYNLKSFTFVSTYLEFPDDTLIEAMLHPFFISRSLEFLHWELDPRFCDDAHYVLAESILANGLPSLRCLRSIHDPFGILQSVCRPISQPLFSFAVTGQQSALSSSTSPLISQIDANRPTGLALSYAEACDRASRALYPQRRYYADGQTKMSFVKDEDAYMRICVVDENGWVVEAADTPAFMGRIGPNVPEYWLQSDLPGGNEAVVRTDQLLGGPLPEKLERRKPWSGLELAKFI